TREGRPVRVDGAGRQGLSDCGGQSSPAEGGDLPGLLRGGPGGIAGAGRAVERVEQAAGFCGDAGGAAGGGGRGGGNDETGAAGGGGGAAGRSCNRCFGDG